MKARWTIRPLTVKLWTVELASDRILWHIIREQTVQKSIKTIKAATAAMVAEATGRLWSIMCEGTDWLVGSQFCKRIKKVLCHATA